MTSRRRPAGWLDTAVHTVTAPLTGLVPGALYHVRLAAVNAAGTTFGRTRRSPPPRHRAPPPPVLGQSQDIKPVSGKVFIKTAAGQFIPLTGATKITDRQRDRRDSRLAQIVAALGKGKTDHGIFGGAIFKLTQARTGLTTLSLVEGAFKGAPSFALARRTEGRRRHGRRALEQDPPAPARQRPRQVPHQRPLQRGDRPRDDLDGRRPLRRDAHARHHRLACWSTTSSATRRSSCTPDTATWPSPNHRISRNNER